MLFNVKPVYLNSGFALIPLDRQPIASGASEHMQTQARDTGKLPFGSVWTLCIDGICG